VDNYDIKLECSPNFQENINNINITNENYEPFKKTPDNLREKLNKSPLMNRASNNNTEDPYAGQISQELQDTVPTLTPHQHNPSRENDHSELELG